MNNDRLLPPSYGLLTDIIKSTVLRYEFGEVRGEDRVTIRRSSSKKRHSDWGGLEVWRKHLFDCFKFHYAMKRSLIQKLVGACSFSGCSFLPIQFNTFNLDLSFPSSSWQGRVTTHELFICRERAEDFRFKYWKMMQDSIDYKYSHYNNPFIIFFIPSKPHLA